MNRTGILLLCSLFFVNRLTAQDLITISNPNGGEVFRGGSVVSVTWNSSGSVPNVNIDYNDGTTWIPVSDAQNLPNTGSYQWQVPDISTAEAKIRVVKSSDGSVSDISDNNFRIITPNIFSNPVRIMPLGNSITFDTRKVETRPDGEKFSYRLDLWDALRADNISFDFVGTQSSGYDVFPDHQNEGHSGWRDDQIALNIYGWLQSNPNTDIILLHIGTNALDSSRADVQNILNQIDVFENNNAKQIWVVLARIINRVPYSSLTTTFNNNIEDMVNARINNGDKIIMVDMEDGAGLNYAISTTPPYSGGDMYDDLHPNPNGYSKMANVWYNALKLLVPAPAPSAPVIVSNALVNAAAGQIYTYDVDANGVGAPDYYLAVKPSGMVINSNTGKITWTPSSGGNYNVSVEARNSSGSDFQNFTIVVSDAPDCSPAMISYWKLDEASGTLYSDQIGTNNAVAGTTAPIPASGQVAGAQQFNGFHQINVSADPSFDFAANSSFSVEFWYKGSSVPTTVKSAVGRYIGATGARWWVGLNANDGRARFFMSAGGASAAVLGNVITDGNWHHVTATRNGATGALRIYVDGVLRSSTTKFFTTGFESPTASLNIGWLSQQSVYSIAGTLDEVAIHNTELSSADIQTHYNSGLSGSGYCGGAPAQSAPVITSTPVTTANVGAGYSYDVNATGNPSPTYILTTSPSGMTINSTTGLIQWTPSAIGNFNVTVAALNGINPNASQSFTITVSGNSPVITSSPVTTGIVGQLYSYDVNATGNPSPTYSLTTSPSGMTINSTTGLIQWTPSAEGSFNVTVAAANGNLPNASQSFTISVTDAGSCPPNMISYWKLDEASGTSYSDQIGANTATAGTAAPIPVQGQVSGAQQFNGSSSQINVPADASFDFAANSSFSVEFWYKGSSVPTTVKSAVGRYISATGARWWVGLNANDGKARFYMSAGGASAAVLGTVITDGNWHHVTATRNGTTSSLKIYVDGVLRSSTTKSFTSGFESSTASLNIGWLSQQSVYSIAGTLDEVAIHSVELSSADIQTHYNNGLAALGYCGGTPPSQTAPVITSTPVTTANVGQAYSYDVNATGNPTPTYSLTTFPAGMTINSTTGLIQWTPSASGSYNVTARASNGVNPNATQSFTINVGTANVCPSGLISYWKLDETSGSIYSDVLGSHNAQGGSTIPTPVSGRVSGAQQFNGSTTTINVPSSTAYNFSSTQSFAIELWVKTSTAVTGNKVFIGRYLAGSVSWWVGYGSDNKVNLEVRDSQNKTFSVKSTSNINDGNWHHIAAIRDAGDNTLKIYLDGSLEGSTTTAFTGNFSSTSAINIGYFINNYYFTGILDEIAVYGTALTLSQVQQHYNNGLSNSGYCSQTGIAKSTTDNNRLLEFSAASDKGSVKLQWEAAGDVNTFLVERRSENKNIADPDDWKEIAKLTGVEEQLLYTYEDHVLNDQKNSFSYRIKLINADGDYTYSEELKVVMVPSEYNLYQNYPNPFNPVTTIKFSLPAQERVTISVFNQLGEKVTDITDQYYEPGVYELQFNAGMLSSGVYFYQMKAGNYSSTKKFILAK